MNSHTDDFVKQRSGLMQAIVRRAMSGGEGPIAFLTTLTTPSALRGGVERMANDVTFAKLAVEAASGIAAAARYASSDLHTCLMTEEAMEIQEHSRAAGLPVTINNT
jgi:hypothetical protein